MDSKTMRALGNHLLPSLCRIYFYAFCVSGHQIDCREESQREPASQPGSQGKKGRTGGREDGRRTGGGQEDPFLRQQAVHMSTALRRQEFGRGREPVLPLAEMSPLPPVCRARRCGAGPGRGGNLVLPEVLKLRGGHFSMLSARRGDCLLTICSRISQL